jgi:hypothetical protein
MRVLIFGILLVGYGCSSKSFIAVKENQGIIKQLKHPLNVKNVTFKGKNIPPSDIGCRLEGDIRFPDGKDILTYMKKSLKDELARGNKLKVDGDTLSIDFHDITISTIQKYYWHFKGVLQYETKIKKDFDVSYQTPSVMWSKYDCHRALYDYNRAQRKLFRAFYNIILNEL